jgi:hypothetical protein
MIATHAHSLIEEVLALAVLLVSLELRAQLAKRGWGGRRREDK